MIRITPLYSGSKGNALLINIDGYKILIDCGKTFNKLRKALAEANTNPAEIKAVFVSHNHTDHVHAIKKLAKHIEKEGRPNLQVFAEHKCKDNDVPGLEIIEAGGSVLITPGHCQVQPFRLTHDDDCPCLGFVIEAQDNKIVYISDSDGIPCEELHRLIDCDCLVAELNHDIDTLIESCPYPDELKLRVGETHCNIDQTCNIIWAAMYGNPRLEHVVCWHLSGNSLNVELAKYSVEDMVRLAGPNYVDESRNPNIYFASQDEVGETITLM